MIGDMGEMSATVVRTHAPYGDTVAGCILEFEFDAGLASFVISNNNASRGMRGLERVRPKVNLYNNTA